MVAVLVCVDVGEGGLGGGVGGTGWLLVCWSGGWVGG